MTREPHPSAGWRNVGQLMHAFGMAAVAVMLAFVAIAARADDGVAKPPASPSGTQAGGSDGQSEKRLPTKKDKQRAVETATRGSASTKEPMGDRGPPKPEKSWDEMTPAEQDAAKKRWLFNSGDFGSPGGAPKAAPPPRDKGPAAIDGTRPPFGQKNGSPTK